MQQNRHLSGFSLVELSIVLVILGLLVGGILGGQSLIRAAELRTITTEFQNFQTAINSFRMRYGALPGDFTLATRFWGAADTSGANGNCADPLTDEGSSATHTCNGNGDGNVADVSDFHYERMRFWQHLGNAGLIAGSYSGRQGENGKNHWQIGVNAPASRISAVGWSISSGVYGSLAPGYDQWWGRGMGELKHSFNLGSERPNQATYNPAFTPEEVWSIDSKLDDGKPATGLLWAIWPEDCAIDRDAPDTTDYKLDETGAVCAINFPMAF